MKRTIVAMAAGGVLTLGLNAPALAQPAVMTAEGRCEFVVNSGQVASSAACRRLTLSEDEQTGETVLKVEFDTGLTFEIAGPALQLNNEWRFLSPSQVAWTNPGAKRRQDLTNRTDSERDQIAGRCSIALQGGATRLYEVYCNLKSPIGDIRMEFKVPRS